MYNSRRDFNSVFCKNYSLVLFAVLYGHLKKSSESQTKMRLSSVDPNSYSTPENEIIQHVDLDWTVDFDKKILKGNALLKFKIIAKSIKTIVSIY